MTLPYIYPTVSHMLANAAERHPQGEALVCGPERLSYAEYRDAVGAFATELADLAGQRVALLLGNSIDLVVAILAVQTAGAVVVPLNPLTTAHELGPILADAKPAMLLYCAEAAAMALPLAAKHGIGRTLAIGAGARRLAAGRGAMPKLPDPDTLSTLQYTGGTTGQAKGVELTHRALAVNVSQREGLLPTRADCERVLAITPLFHVYATAMCLYLAIYCRGCLVILPRYHPRLVLDAIEAERITLFAGSPTIFNGLLGFDGFAATDFSSLRMCFSGASALSPELLRRWEAATGAPVCEGFGQTETGPVLAFNPFEGERRRGSVGIAVPGTLLRIVDAATGTNILPVGEIGEVCAKGPALMRGYRNLMEQTNETLRDGWLHTGDIGWLDADGYLTICDRKKDMVIVSGFNVYPREVEDALFLHKAVAEAAVIGVPHVHRGEVLHAYIVFRPGETASDEELTAHLVGLLAAYKVPRSFINVPNLPKTVVGKIDKRSLRANRTSLGPSENFSSDTNRL